MTRLLRCGICLMNNSLKYVLLSYNIILMDDFSNDCFLAVCFALVLCILRLLSTNLKMSWKWMSENYNVEWYCLRVSYCYYYYLLLYLFAKKVIYCLLITVLQKKETFVKQFMKQLSRDIARNNDHYKPHMIKHRHVLLYFTCSFVEFWGLNLLNAHYVNWFII